MLEKKADFEFCQDENLLAEDFGRNFFDELKEKKESLRLGLSLSTFQAQCHVTNDLLINKRLFLRVYELRKKFRYLIKTIPQKKNVVQRELSTCFEERFNGFEIIRKLTENEKKKCSSRLTLFTSLCQNLIKSAVSELKKGKEMTTEEQYYVCNKFFIQKNIARNTLKRWQLHA